MKKPKPAINELDETRSTLWFIAAVAKQIHDTALDRTHPYNLNQSIKTLKSISIDLLEVKDVLDSRIRLRSKEEPNDRFGPQG